MEWLRGGEARARRDWGREGHDGTPGTHAHRGGGRLGRVGRLAGRELGGGRGARGWAALPHLAAPPPRGAPREPRPRTALPPQPPQPADDPSTAGLGARRDPRDTRHARAQQTTTPRSRPQPYLIAPSGFRCRDSAACAPHGMKKP